MKKILLGLAAVATILASCSKNETFDSIKNNGTNDPNRIAFQATSGVAARGAVADIETLKVLTDGFKVYEATLFDTDNGANYKYDSGTGLWDWVDATDKDWPTEENKYPLTFYSIHPTTALSGLMGDAGVAVKPKANVADQIDILGAYTKVDVKPATGIVPLEFRHILSAIKFQLMSSDGYSVNIKGIKIVNVKTERNFNQRTITWETEPIDQTTSYTYFESTAATSMQALQFANPAQALAIKSGNFADATVVDAGQLMLVPQTGTAANVAGFTTAAKAWNGTDPFPTTEATAALNEGAYIEVVYNMADATGTYVIGEAGKYIRVFYPLSLEAAVSEWEEGKRYTYTLYLGTADSSNGTILDPSYKGEDGSDVDPPAGGEDPVPGDPVSKGKITFKVDVAAWTEVGSDIK